MTYHLLDHINRRNAAELARCEAVGHECAAPLRTHGWTPPSDVVTCKQFDVDRNRHHVRYLGRGDRISCGKVIESTQFVREPNVAGAISRAGLNVTRPFDENEMECEFYREWFREPRRVFDETFGQWIEFEWSWRDRVGSCRHAVDAGKIIVKIFGESSNTGRE